MRINFLAHTKFPQARISKINKNDIMIEYKTSSLKCAK